MKVINENLIYNQIVLKNDVFTPTLNIVNGAQVLFPSDCKKMWIDGMDCFGLDFKLK